MHAHDTSTLLLENTTTAHRCSHKVDVVNIIQGISILLFKSTTHIDKESILHKGLKPDVSSSYLCLDSHRGRKNRVLSHCETLFQNLLLIMLLNS